MEEVDLLNIKEELKDIKNILSNMNSKIEKLENLLTNIDETKKGKIIQWLQHTKS
jgi:hypothetical protein